jgi:hypothetical protein
MKSEATVRVAVPYYDPGLSGTGGSFYSLDRALSVLRNQLMHYATYERRWAEDLSRRDSAPAKRKKRIRLTLDVEIEASAKPEAQAAA